ncbi:trypsin-like [Cetorhinus maximus]
MLQEGNYPPFHLPMNGVRPVIIGHPYLPLGKSPFGLLQSVRPVILSLRPVILSLRPVILSLRWFADFFPPALLVSAVSCSHADRIVGGYECAPHSLPYQVYITYVRRPWCGGSLLNSQWILSAAHCHSRSNRLKVWVGAHDLSIDEGSRQSPRVVKAIQHPHYDYGTTDNDIMLMKVSPPVQFNEKVQPIRLPSSCASVGTQCIASGWGNMINGEEQFPDRLQCLEVPILSDTECGSSYKDSITPNMFCAGFLEGGKETCQADSGGPLVCAGEQQGIVSWGFACGHPGYPSVYTKLCNYISWINETIAAN